MMKLKVNRLTKNLCFQPKVEFLDYLPSPLSPEHPLGPFYSFLFSQGPPSLPHLSALCLVLFLVTCVLV